MKDRIADFNSTLESDLLAIKAIKISPEEPFTWASGWNSPIYCDNRLTLSYPVVRTKIRDGIIAMIEEEFKEYDAIAGVATAGVPQGAILADSLGVPFCYVRSKPKGHGMKNMIEGHIEDGDRVIVVEDLVSTGKSSLAAVDALREVGCEVLGMVSIFTYNLEVAKKNLEEAGVKLASLSNYDLLLEEAVKTNYINASQIEKLKAWKASPETWTA